MRCPSPITLKDPARIKSSRALVVPCGYCGACRHNKRAMWSFRIKEEVKVSENAYFVTLTYNDQNLVYGDYEPTLVKSDMQKFIKRLRKVQNKKTQLKLRYYCVGEYGTNTQRPHYHAVLFNVAEHTIQKMAETWGKGHVDIKPVNEAMIHYTTKYHVNFDKRSRKGKEKEFALMSLKPAIGAAYIEKQKKWHTENENLYVINNGYKMAIPRYYKGKIFPAEKLDKMRDETYIKVDKDFDEEYERLKNLDIVEPIEYIRKSQKQQSDRVKDKGRSSDKL